MKPYHYQKKYKLLEGDDFDHEEFISDFTSDFLSLVEWHRLQVKEWTYSNFKQCVKEIRDKWDAINNKTVGQMPEKLWDYFYAAVVCEMRDQMFPEIKEGRQKVKDMATHELVEYLKDCGIPVLAVDRDITYANIPAMKKEVEKSVKKFNNHFLRQVFIEFTRRYDARMEEVREQREKERERREERDSFSFFDYIIATVFKRMAAGAIPEEEFEVLGLDSDASEQDIKTRYRELVKKHHPDKGGNKKKFMEITKAKNKCLAYHQLHQMKDINSYMTAYQGKE